MRLFEKWAKAEGKDVKSSLELADITGADPELVGRVLRHLAAMGSVKEIDANKYALTPFSETLTHTFYSDAYYSMFDTAGPGFFALPDLLEKTKFINPIDPDNGAFQLGHRSPDHWFKWLSERPAMASKINNHMAGRRKGETSWTDPGFYPVNENLVEGAQEGPDEVFLVDVGGGKGQNLADLHQKYPNLPGQLILQDRKPVIDEAHRSTLDPKIVLMEHDFFTEQPIKGARTYYIHSCLHDWPDPEALKILIALGNSMKKGYSKLLINEYVIPDRNAHWAMTGLDILMMANFSAKERTEQNWRSLLDTAGFRIVKIWTYEPGSESLIEAELM